MIASGGLQKYKCGNCSHIFNEQQAVCEDWRDPKKSLICPECDSYLEVTVNKKEKIYNKAWCLLFPAIALDIYFRSSKAITLVTIGFLICLHLWAADEPFARVARTNVINPT